MKSMRISGARRANGCIKEGELPRREMLRNELDPDDHQHGDERRKNESGRGVELECPESGKAQHLQVRQDMAVGGSEWLPTRP